MPKSRQSTKNNYAADIAEIRKNIVDAARTGASSERGRAQSYSTDIALLKAEMSHINETLNDIKREQGELKKELSELNEAANRYKGGIFIILFLGGVLGALITFADKIWNIIHAS